MYRPDGGGYIFVNSQAAFVRQRFTAAHEIGHHRLHGDQAFIESSLDEPDDWEANCFAEAFLVDPIGVGRLLADAEREVPRMVAITCDAYWVSQSAAAIILRHFGLISQPELDGFLAQNWTYASLLREYGLKRRGEPRRGETELPPHFRERTLRLVEAGQLAAERAASMLGVESADLDGLVAVGEADPLHPSRDAAK